MATKRKPIVPTDTPDGWTRLYFTIDKIPDDYEGRDIIFTVNNSWVPFMVPDELVRAFRESPNWEAKLANELD